MKAVGFPISHKENENRRAIIPEHIKLMKSPESLYFEKGYGEILGIDDSEYSNLGCRICSREEALSKQIICDPKIGDADYLESLKPGQTIFGWVHATQNKDITDKIIKNAVTAYAWEKMFYNGRHVFWRNNELAGEAAVMHAFQCFGIMPYETKVAVIGKGNTARGVVKILNMLGADTFQYDRRTEKLFKEEIGKYDIVINCVLWDVTRKDHIIAREDLKRMKKNSMIIDVSCDRHGAVESSEPTTIENPTYIVDGIVHYVVDHTPALYYKTFSKDNSETVYPYIEQLMTDKPDKVLQSALIIKDGIIIDEEINRFQRR
ncbi:MAG: N(5)-(carboxyethyl)ornithine synthase [Acutalibacteraceae bacterium]